LREPEHFGAWCRSIARSASLDAARRRGRRKRTPPENREAPVSAETPERSATLREQKEQVLSAVRGLPEEYQLPILLRYMDDLSYEEMAERLGISHGALRGTLHRGMTLLRARLGAALPAAGRAEPQERSETGQA
jgi:RNA polymerase sigma-70 factor (ECF subfamily)